MLTRNERRSGRQLGEHVAGQVLANHPRARAEAGQDPPALLGRLAGRRQVEELEAGRPALGPARQAGDLLGPDGDLVEVAEQPLHLPRSKSEVVRPDLEQAARDPPAGEVEGRLRARADQDREARRQVVDEPFEGLFGGRRFEHVEVVDHEQDPAGRHLLEGPAGRLDASASPG